MVSKNIHIEKIINPEEKIQKEIDNFFNSGFFEVRVGNYIGNEIYYVIRDNNGDIIAARKVIYDLQKILKKTSFYERLKNHIDYNKKAYYLQALCVKKEEQNKGYGSMILEATMNDFEENSQVFGALYYTNTIKNKYFEKYNFQEISVEGKRIIVKRVN